MKQILSTLFILSLLSILIACSPQKKYDIIVSDYFTYDIVKNVTGDTLAIKTLQPIHMDYHTYEPSSSDLVTLNKANLFIYTSLSQSPWLKSESQVDNLIENHIAFEDLLGDDLHFDVDNDHEHDHEHGFDFLSNPYHVATIVQKLAVFLTDLYPEHSTLFETNAQNYYDALISLIKPYHTLFHDAHHEIYFIGHNALSGFSAAFDLTVHALDAHVSPHSDTTSTDLSQFIKHIKQNNIQVIYHEEVPNLQTLNYMNSQLPGIIMYELHTFHQMKQVDYDAGLGYIDLIQRNLENLNKGLNV